MLSTTFVKVVCWDDTVWGYSDKSWTIARFPGLQTKRVRCRLVHLGKRSEELLLGRLAIDDAPEILITNHSTIYTKSRPFAPP